VLFCLRKAIGRRNIDDGNVVQDQQGQYEHGFRLAEAGSAHGSCGNKRDHPDEKRPLLTLAGQILPDTVLPRNQ